MAGPTTEPKTDKLIEGQFREGDETAVALREQTEIGLLRDPDLVLDEAHKAAAALGRVIAGKKRKIVLNGKQYLEVEDWVLLGQFYGVSGKTEWTRPVEFGEVKGWEARVVVIDQRTGNEVGGAEAMCLDDERNWKGKDSFQIRSMAQTRALGKALSGRLRWIPVLAGYAGTPAEEMTETPPPPKDAAPNPADSAIAKNLEEKAAAPTIAPMSEQDHRDIAAAFRWYQESSIKGTEPAKGLAGTVVREWGEWMKSNGTAGKWAALWTRSDLVPKARELLGIAHLDPPKAAPAPEPAKPGFDPTEIPT